MWIKERAFKQISLLVPPQDASPWQGLGGMRSHVAFPALSRQLCWPQQGDGSEPCKHPRSLSGAASRQGARGEHLTYVSGSGHENRAPACTPTCGIWQASPGEDQQPCLVASSPGAARGIQGWPWSAKMEGSLHPAHAGKIPAQPGQHLPSAFSTPGPVRDAEGNKELDGSRSLS